MNNALVRWENYSPVSLGLEDMFKRLDAFQDSSASNYPPYNIVKIDDVTQQLEIALAGFSRDEIEVAVEKNILTVSTNTEGTDGREYTHKGLARRTFARNWQLSDDTVVEEVTYVDGLLSINIRKEVPEAQKRRLLPIS
jgi:molecular chaperone IbpA